MTEAIIDYNKIVNRAMHQVVKDVLRCVAVSKKCNLLIAFSTRNKKVIIPDELRRDYPEQMSIVLNNQFSDLIVYEVGFMVTLSFSGVQKTLSIPFNALISFLDRDVKFSIEFKHFDEFDEDDDYISASKGILNKKSDIESGTSKKGKIIYFNQFFKPENKDNF